MSGHPDVTADPYAVENLFRQPDESWDEYLLRMCALYHAAPTVREELRTRQGRPPKIDAAAVLACLSYDDWTSCGRIGERLGEPSHVVRRLLCRLRRDGYAIESRNPSGWRLLRTGVAA